MESSKNLAALSTTRQEIFAQADVVRESLLTAQNSLEKICCKVLALQQPSKIISVGIGDSNLIGELASIVCNQNLFLPIKAVKSTEISVSELDPLLDIALIHSISGKTSATVAAASLIQSYGVRSISFTDASNSPLERQTNNHVQLVIPRFPPDAKVPGTLTISVPLIATILLSTLLNGNSYLDALNNFCQDISTSLVSSTSTWLKIQDDISGKISSNFFQIVYPSPLKSLALYAESKFAEYAMINSSSIDSETWFHVNKHAVNEETIVLVIAPKAFHPSLINHLCLEVQLRNGRTILLDEYKLITETNDSYTLPITSSCVSINIGELLYHLFLIQLLCVNILELNAQKAPFQLHRLTQEQVRGMRSRIYNLSINS